MTPNYLLQRTRWSGHHVLHRRAWRAFEQKRYLRLLLHDREHEVFVVVLLDAQNRVFATEELFRGTLTQTSVYPKEVVKVPVAAS